ncbi:MAG: hypothetical protein HQL72_02485 [Magnetococcales bacterium]|nr:hypothetical protein [Magnetococcales bacterium]
MNHWGFMNTMLRQFTSLVLEICQDNNAGAAWAELSREDISQLMVELSLTKEVRAQIRCTATAEWFQVECGPVKSRVPYTRNGAETIDRPLDEIREWILDYFDDPESVDQNHLPDPMMKSGPGLLWPVEGFSAQPLPVQPQIENTTVH